MREVGRLLWPAASLASHLRVDICLSALWGVTQRHSKCVQGEGLWPQKRSVRALSPFLLRTAKARYELQGQHPRRSLLEGRLGPSEETPVLLEKALCGQEGGVWFLGALH